MPRRRAATRCPGPGTASWRPTAVKTANWRVDERDGERYLPGLLRGRAGRPLLLLSSTDRYFFSKPDVDRILSVEVFRQAWGPPLQRVPENDVLAGIDLS